MYYSIRHLTKFLYSNPVSESMMETRMHPRSDHNQRCLTFHLSVSPRCRVFSYRDPLGEQCAPLRYSWAARATGDRGRIAG